MRPLEDWDANYLIEVATIRENEFFEKKRSGSFNLGSNGRPSAETENEIAKQVCAFANAGGGFLVFGIDDANRILDEGVPKSINRTSIEDWTAKKIPQLVYPGIFDCLVRFYQLENQHDADKGALVVWTPLSERRPHWVKEGGREIAYLRTGAHSEPMTIRTLLDISSRTAAPEGEILSLGKWHQSFENEGRVFNICPRVRIQSGPICRDWGVELKINPVNGKFATLNAEQKLAFDSQNSVFLEGPVPLFPGKTTRTYPVKLVYFGADANSFITASLFAEGARPMEKRFNLLEFVESQNEPSPS
jgi:hypothetical protein